MVETLRGIHIFTGLSEECFENLSSVMQFEIIRRRRTDELVLD